MPADTAFHMPSSPVAMMGTIVLWVSFVVAAYAVASGIVGNVKQNRRLVASSVSGLYAFFALMMLASALIVYAFVTHDYAIKYVSRYSDTTMPIWYKLTAYWGGLDGSLLFWVSVLAAFAAIAVKMNRSRHRDTIGYVVATIMTVQLFFVAILIYNKNPFQEFLTAAPADGEGLNPLLQNYWMVIHPPSLYVGFVSATIPFAFGIAALASGRLDDTWLRSVRSWTLVCFFFLSLGLILGGRWAYEELGWGGYWAWDPVENAGLLPWFTATAFLHSVIIQEQRSMMKLWNLMLVILTFLLTIFGTFMTRSGIVQSVHAFGEDKQLALMFILFMTFVVVVSLGLLVFRAPKLRAANTFESFVSREFAFLLNNWILLGCAFFVLFATMFPTISEWMDGNRITVGPDFFNKWMTPLGLTLLFLSGAAPLLAWRKTTRERLMSQFAVPVGVAIATLVVLAIFVPRTLVRTPIFSGQIRLPISLVNFALVAFVVASIAQEFWKGVRVRIRQTKGTAMTSLIGLVLTKRRKYGGYIVHLGVAIMFLGWAGKAYESMQDFTVSAPGQTFQLRGYTFSYDDLIIESDEHRREVTAHVTLKDRDGELLDVMRPAKWFFTKSDQPTTEVAIKSKLIREDIYLILTGYEESTKKANFRAYVNPLINWFWLGFAFLSLGVAICLIPQAWVDSLSPRRSRLGRIAEAAVLIVTIGSVVFGFVQVARAQAPAGEPQKLEYSEAPRHGDGAGYAHVHRPENPTSTKAMKELVCLCGGCQRESIYECRCGYAAGERQKVARILASMDLPTDRVDEQAYQTVIDSFIAEYGERVLSTPKSQLSWAMPLAALGGALLVLLVLGRRWVRHGRTIVSDSATTRGAEEDEYADILDDELRDTD